MPAGFATMTFARLPATSSMPRSCEGLGAVTWFRMVVARWLPNMGFPATCPATCVWLAAPLLLSTTPDGPTLNCVNRLLDTPPAEGGAMLTTGTPLATPTTGFCPATFWSTEIGKVCARTGVQICAKTNNQAIVRRNVDISGKTRQGVKPQPLPRQPTLSPPRTRGLSTKPKAPIRKLPAYATQPGPDRTLEDSDFLTKREEPTAIGPNED
ncbi:hypothetical protein LMG3458_03724 [Achromobacter deleyi]|uniref:Uncharacterized protein n=1 Tax=Achromobacter deleyi TaxID=1353891 RepID=A0A6S7A984_9BURK|nr:hypothetical protein LMG3458_03724 [Achromobacter deleyi]CAB3884579.1 hypothetical protein LMG3482_03476 [Achromobacter deleyi]